MDLKLKNNSQLTLTNGYIPVEYVESSGYPDINTGLSCYHNPFNIKIEATIDVISNGNAEFTIYSGSYSNGPFFNLVAKSNSNSSFYASCCRQNTNVSPLEIEFSGKSHIISARGYITVNGTTYTQTPSNRGVSATFYLLHAGNAIVRSYSYKIYQSTTLVRDYIPVISYQEGHFGEACLYDKVNGVFYYSASTGSFTAYPSQGLYDIITSAYIKDCPNVSGINILRSCANLTRIRCNINNSTGHTAEIYKYAQLSGFNDAGEQQTKPRIVGTFTIDYYSNEELNYINSTIDGLTVNVDSSKNIDNLLETDGLRVQTLDSTKPNYNPAVAIAMHNAGYDVNVHYPIIEGGGTWCRPKSLPTTITTQLRGLTSIVDTEGIVSDDTTAEYDFENFEEFQYFDNTSLTAGTSTSNLGSFGNCTKLKKIILPPTVTSIGAYAFYNCTALEDITIPSSVTSIGTYTFYNCVKLKDLTIPCNVDITAFRYPTMTSQTHVGDKTGTLIIKGNLNAGSQYSTYMDFAKILIYGTARSDTGGGLYVVANASVRIRGNYTSYARDGGFRGAPTAFLEFMSNVSGYNSNSRIAGTASSQNVQVCHLGQNSVVTATPTIMAIGKISMIYVGDGSSRANDEAVLALYLADTGWSAYSAKLGTWYDYNGTYKWYYITDNLTNCTNTNPDAWPHITRGLEYKTTIVADEGYTLGTVKVEMYSARDNSLTPDEPIDITSAVYNASTGEIYIQEVVGNVIITASAS